MGIVHDTPRKRQPTWARLVAEEPLLCGVEYLATLIAPSINDRDAFERHRRTVLGLLQKVTRDSKWLLVRTGMAEQVARDYLTERMELAGLVRAFADGRKRITGA